MRSEDIVIENGNRPITATLFAGNTLRTVVVALHGFGSARKSDTVLSIAAAASLKGAAVLTFDMPGHGDRLKQGGFTAENLINDFKKVIAYARDNISDKVGIFCTSLGAYAGLAGALGEQGIARIFLKSPALLPAKVLTKLQAIGAFGDGANAALADGFVKSIAQLKIECDVYKIYAGYAGAPIDILYGEKDELIDKTDILRFLALSPSISLAVIEGEGHRFTSGAAKELVVRWFVSGLLKMQV